jgi:hypothetical protein
MPSVARLLRAQLIPPQYYWVVKGVGATTAAAGAAYACFGHAWLPGFVFAAVATGLALDAANSASRTYVVRRARRRARAGGCVRCGYPLRGLTSLKCPECGAPLIARRLRPDPLPPGLA